MIHVLGALFSVIIRSEDRFLLAEVRNTQLRWHCTEDDVVVIHEEAFWALNVNWFSLYLLLGTNCRGTSHISKWESFKLFDGMRLFGGKSTLRIVTIPHEYRNEEHGNDEEHLAKLQHHIEIGIDTETKDQEWIIN